MAAFMLIFAFFGAAGLVSFDIVLPVVIMGAAFITYMDAKRKSREGRTDEARSLMNVVTFMIALIMIYFLCKLT